MQWAEIISFFLKMKTIYEDNSYFTLGKALERLIGKILEEKSISGPVFYLDLLRFSDYVMFHVEFQMQAY